MAEQPDHKRIPDEDLELWRARLNELDPDDWVSFYADRLLDAYEAEYAERDKALARIAKEEAKCENLKRQAEQWAQEARTQESTVQECYKIVGSKRGTWSGAAPVQEFADTLKARIAELEEELLEANQHIDALLGKEGEEDG